LHKSQENLTPSILRNTVRGFADSSCMDQRLNYLHFKLQGAADFHQFYKLLGRNIANQYKPAVNTVAGTDLIPLLVRLEKLTRTTMHEDIEEPDLTIDGSLHRRTMGQCSEIKTWSSACEPAAVSVSPTTGMVVAKRSRALAND
jgi:hypothetical protein